jgi:hypothetical protein
MRNMYDFGNKNAEVRSSRLSREIHLATAVKCVETDRTHIGGKGGDGAAGLSLIAEDRGVVETIEGRQPIGEPHPLTWYSVASRVREGGRVCYLFVTPGASAFQEQRGSRQNDFPTLVAMRTGALVLQS